MKVDLLKKMIREEVRGAIKDELKDILLEAILASRNQPVQPPIQRDNRMPNNYSPQIPSPSREQLRESYRNILGETAASFNTSQVGMPLQVATFDTTSPNGRLPEGDVPMNMIMGLLNTK